MSDLNVIINICLEIPAFILSLIMLGVCLIKRKTAGQIGSLSMILIAYIGVLWCQLSQWGLILSVNHLTMTPFKFFLRWVYYIGEYWFGAFLTVAVLFYVPGFAKGFRAKERNYRLIMLVNLFTSVGQSLIMTLAPVTHWPYFFDELGHLVYTGQSVLIFILCYSLALLCPLYVVVLERKELGFRKLAVFACYGVATILSMTFDLDHNTVIGYVLLSFIFLLFYFAIDLRESEKAHIQELELAKKDSQMSDMSVRLVMSQIQPHFLYNALSTIAYLCGEDPKEAAKATNEFAGYLRANLKSLNSKDPIPFAREIDHVQNYLKVEQRRFSDQMNVVYDIEAMDFLIPPLALQPIVENSVHHGVETRYELTTIKVMTRELEKEFVVIVEDDGPGFDTAMEFNDDRLHVGIASTRTRLKEMVNGYMDIESEIGKGTKVTIHIPKGEDK